MSPVRVTVNVDRVLPHTLIEGDRGSGKTTEAIALAAEWQDAGYTVIFVVPQAHHVEHLFPMMFDTLDTSKLALDMSRVEIWTYDHVAEGGLRGMDPMDHVLILEEVGLARESTLGRVLAHHGESVVGRTLSW